MVQYTRRDFTGGILELLTALSGSANNEICEVAKGNEGRLFRVKQKKGGVSSLRVAAGAKLKRGVVHRLTIACRPMFAGGSAATFEMQVEVHVI